MVRALAGASSRVPRSSSGRIVGGSEKQPVSEDGGYGCLAFGDGRLRFPWHRRRVSGAHDEGAFQASQSNATACHLDFGTKTRRVVEPGSGG